MKVTSVELVSENANIFSFALSQVGATDKYLARAIVGLDADELIHKFYGFGRTDKKRFYNFSIAKREIAMRIVLNPNYEVNDNFSEIRDELYRSISSSRSGQVQLLFYDVGSVVASVSGFISKFEVPLFSETPELQITIKCDDPMFRGFNRIELYPEDLPSTNPILISDSISTAPHGVTMEVEFTAITPQFTVSDESVNPTWEFQVIPDGGFLVGDILHLSSEFGNEQLYIDRSGTIIPLMDKIVPQSVWPLIFPGGNDFYFPEIANFDWVKITHFPAYWGV